MKQNCWEFKKCGREPNGEKSQELGVCPASTERQVHGLNDGINGGRSCWAVSGTLCGGQVQGAFASKLGNCLECDFYSKVRAEEASNFVTSKEILAILQSKEAA
jgi:hypothetical protein